MQDLQKLKEILSALRNPKTGCPWDRVQTFTSIAPNTVEEAYEVLEAIEDNDYEHIKEEIGDLLLHVLFYSDMAKEAGKFDFNDVVDALCSKLISRHPHVFGDAKANDAAEALASWESVKAKERTTKKKQMGALEGIAVTLPSSTRAFKLQKRAARVGFDVDGKKALSLLKSKIKTVQNASPKDEENALGSMLFSAINLARKMGINPDTALRKYNRKFETRFANMEKIAAAKRKNIKDFSKAELSKYWKEAKSF